MSSGKRRPFCLGLNVIIQRSESVLSFQFIGLDIDLPQKKQQTGLSIRNDLLSTTK